MQILQFQKPVLNSFVSKVATFYQQEIVYLSKGDQFDLSLLSPLTNVL